MIALASAASTAARADIFLDVIVDGNDITLGPQNFTTIGGPGSGPSPDGSAFTLNVDVTLLNAALAGLNIPVMFNSLSAVSNFPTTSASATAFLTVTADASYSATSGSSTIQIFATGTDYNFPTGNGTLGSTASATFTNAGAGNNESFVSYYNAANAIAPPLAGINSPTLNLVTVTGNDSKSGTAATTPLGGITHPYSLQNLTQAVIGPAGASNAKMGPFGGSTTVVVPEPTGLALVGIGLSVIVAGRLRRHRTAA
jgi:hypothetical protein